MRFLIVAIFQCVMNNSYLLIGSASSTLLSGSCGYLITRHFMLILGCGLQGIKSWSFLNASINCLHLFIPHFLFWGTSLEFLHLSLLFQPQQADGTGCCYCCNIVNYAQ